MQNLLEITEFEDFKNILMNNKESLLGKVVAISYNIVKSQYKPELIGEITLENKSGDTLIVNRVYKTIPLKEIEKTDDVDAMQLAYQKAEREVYEQLAKNLEQWIAEFKEKMQKEGIVVAKGTYLSPQR